MPTPPAKAPSSRLVHRLLNVTGERSSAMARIILAISILFATLGVMRIGLGG